MISPFEGATKTTIEKIFTLNCFAPIALTQQILPTMKSQQHGIILNLSSTATTHTKPHLGYYAAAKSALEKTMQSLKAELAPTNISIKTVQLGTVNTPWLNNCIYITHPEYHEDLEELIKEMQYTTELAQSPDSAAIQLLNLCPTLFSIRIF
ncbi:MAG: hypothetical protein SP4CHLAM1_18180 [Chlamydiia bacterium]|nr:hypothetical protein [Chlamydiia bacterium]